MSPSGQGSPSRPRRASLTVGRQASRSATRRANACSPPRQTSATNRTSWRAGLRGSRSSLIGVIARDVSDPFHIQVLQGVNEVTRAREFRLFLGHVDYRPDVALTYGSMFERSHADGIIVLGDLADGTWSLADLTTQHRFVVGVSDRVGAGSVPGRLFG